MVAINTVVYESNGETFIWAFAAEEEKKVLSSICDFAIREDINFDWEDANIIWQRMGEAPRKIELRELARYIKSAVN